MKLGDISPETRLILGTVVYIVVVVVAAGMLAGWTALGTAAAFLTATLIAAVAGAASIWYFVRRINRRDAPRKADSASER